MLVTFLVVVATDKQPKKEFVSAYSLRVRSAMEGKAWQQAVPLWQLGILAHIVADRYQRTRNLKVQAQ